MTAKYKKVLFLFLDLKEFPMIIAEFWTEMTQIICSQECQKAELRFYAPYISKTGSRIVFAATFENYFEQKIASCIADVRPNVYE